MSVSSTSTKDISSYPNDPGNIDTNAIQLYARCNPSYPIGPASASNGSSIQTLSPSNANTYWIKKLISTGVYAFVLRNNQSLALTGVPGKFGSLTVSTFSASNTYQQWRYIDTGLADGSHRFYSANNSSYCIDVNYGYSTINAAVTMFNKDSSLDQCILEVSAGSTPNFSCTSSTHKWVDQSITSAATCTSVGSKTQKCSSCGATRTVSIPALGHNYVNSQVVNPTCTADGYTIQKCSRCGATRTLAGASKLGHSFGEWVVTKAPTCTATGTKEQTCSRCGAKNTESIPATGHTPASGLSGYVAPTHTKPGYSGDIVCAKCRAVITRGHTIAAVGHTMGPWTPSGDEHIRICADGAECNIEREPHQYGDWQVTTPATCLTDGEERRTCSVCGGIETRVIPALGHSYGPNEIVGKANLKHVGLMRCTCTRCSHQINTKFLKLKRNKPKNKSI